MKNILLPLYTLIGILFTSMLSASDNLGRSTTLFDSDWLFIKENISGAEEPDYNDSDWRKISLPHDWSIEDLPNQIPDSIVGPFSKASITKRDGGFTIGGTAWYRKHFLLEKSTRGKKVYIQFDGVYMNSDIWINGHHLGNHPYGYSPFYYDITPFLQKPGKSNIIAVRVKNEGVNSRWYSGSGIYRHVWLTVTNPMHIDIWGTYITTPVVSDDLAEVNIETTIKNYLGQKPVTIQAEIYSESGKLVGTNEAKYPSLKANNNKVSQLISIKNPNLWSIDSPARYKAKVRVVQGKTIVDETTTMFGIRSIKFDSKYGFTLNGKNILLKGGCIHHDNGPLGAVAIDRAEERKIELLKQNGYNAIRSAHNPPSTALLDACDRLGMLVIDEAFDAWQKEKKPQDYHLYFDDWWQKDIETMILRDRNHPSIIMWSTGNEIPESIDSIGYKTGEKIAESIRLLDPSRPTTIAIPKYILVLSGQKGKKWDDTAPSYENVDVCGYNYSTNLYKRDHKKHPDRVMYESESFPPDVYKNWEIAKTLPYAIGMFTWTAIDYIGEAGLGVPRIIPTDTNTDYNLFLDPAWPIFNAYCGELDLIGDKKVNSYYLDVVWDRSKVEMLVKPHIPNGFKEVNFYYNFPEQIKSWSFPGDEGKELKVYVHSKADSITLELNGKVISTQSRSPKEITCEFLVPYEPGTLVAKSYVNGAERATDTLKTVGKPYAVKLIADHKNITTNPNDLSFINVQIVDKNGEVVPYADDILVKYQMLNDIGEIAGVGNGNPFDISSFQKPEKKVYRGKGLVILRPNGKQGTAVLRASARGLKDSSIEIVIK